MDPSDLLSSFVDVQSERRLSDYNIQQHSVLDFLLRLRGD